MAVEAGIDLIQHPEILSRDYPDDLLKAIIDRDVLCAIRSNTLGGKVWQAHLDSKRAAEAKLADMPPPRTSAEQREREDALGANYEIQRRNAERLIEAGCTVTIATDNYQGRAPEFWKVPKPDEHEAGIGSIIAIEGLVELGMSEAEAIVAATRNGAIAAGRLDRIGTVEVGKDADLILLDANPLEDIANIRRLVQVIAQGRIVDLASLPEQRLFYTGSGKSSASLPAVPSTPQSTTRTETPAVSDATDDDQDEFGSALAVTRIYTSSLGNIVVELANGQVWRQLESDNTRVVIPDDTESLRVDLQPGMFGSVLLKIDPQQRAFKVARVR
jgi:hypothetical protein